MSEQGESLSLLSGARNAPTTSARSRHGGLDAGMVTVSSSSSGSTSGTLSGGGYETQRLTGARGGAATTAATGGGLDEQTREGRLRRLVSFRKRSLSCKDILLKFRWRILLIAFVMAVLLVAIYFLSANEEEEEEIDIHAVSSDFPLWLPWQTDEPTASAQATIQLPPLKANTTGFNITVALLYLNKTSGVKYLVGDELEVEPELHEPVVVVQDFPALDDINHAEGELAFEITTARTTPVALSFRFVQHASIADYQVLFAAIILICMYILIIFELLHRTLAAMAGSFVAVGVLSAVHERPSLDVIVSWIEYETVSLLFGMMIIVGIFSSTGFFEWCAVQAYKFSNGQLWKLVVMLCVFTGVVSAVLDNVTTVLLITPITVRLCKVLDVDPVPVIMSLVIFSNIGGTGTAIGDPPNVIIVSDSRITGAGIGFLDFTLHLLPGTFFCFVGAFFFVRWRDKQSMIIQKPVSPLIKEIEIWERTLAGLNQDAEEEVKVRAYLHEHIAELELQLVETGGQVTATPVSIQELEEQYHITDVTLFVNCSVVLTCVILLFFLQSFVGLNLSIAWISLIGAVCLMIVSGIHEIDHVFEKVEWGTLVFFAALFCAMSALEELGLIDYLGNATASMIRQVGDGPRLAFSITLILWISGLVSACIDNIPLTTALIPIIVQLANDTELNLPLRPLVWALAFGSCMGGNGTLIGASANVVAAGLSEQYGYPISFSRFFKAGFPVMLITLLIANIYLLIVHVWWGINDI